MTRSVELRRHTDAEGDLLTPEGIRIALEIGGRLQGSYQVMISSGAQRATQTIACFLAGMGRTVAGGVIVETGFRSRVEDRWFAAARLSEGKDLDAFREVDAELVEKESALLGGVLKTVLESLPEGGRAMVVGHSPTTEAAVLGLTGLVIQPLAKGAGVKVIEDGEQLRVESLS